jgi:3-methyl-2-oxobutanoate hydroxymethyltransferase
MTEGLADIVKVEVDASQAGLVEKMSRAGIPICAHVGSLPQRSAMTGGYSSRGRTAADAERIVADAVAAEQAGAALLLVEATPEAVTGAILERTSAPVIGIGAGQGCHGQILVAHDLLGLSEWQPGFAKPEASLGEQITATAVKWREKVLRRESSEHRYRMRPGEAERFDGSGLMSASGPNAGAAAAEEEPTEGPKEARR